MLSSRPNWFGERESPFAEIVSDLLGAEVILESHAVGPFAQFDITLESNGLRTTHSNRAPKLCQTSKSLEITWGR